MNEGDQIEFECLWGYKEAIKYENGLWSFKQAICEPKSRDNSLKTEVILRACKICPVAIKNLRVLKAGYWEDN